MATQINAVTAGRAGPGALTPSCKTDDVTGPRAASRPQRATGIPFPHQQHARRTSVRNAGALGIRRGGPSPLRLVSRSSAGWQQEPHVSQERVDYPANAIDEPVLQQHPGTAIDLQHTTNCFNYPRNLNDRYHVMEQLGAGGFGQVYRAVSVETGIEYACKSIPKRDPGAGYATSHHLLRIRGEVDAMRQLGASLDVASLKEVFEDDVYVHLIIELCSGGPVLKEGAHPAFSEPELAEVMRSVLRFLSQCEAKGVVYRDVKPANFLYSDSSPTRRVKATDFGLAVKHGPGDPPLEAISGTTYFLAPEVLHQQYGSQADVYSAGVMAFMLLTGRYPSVADGTNPTPEQTFQTIRGEDIDFSRLPAEGVSIPAQKFLKRLLTKDPNQRPTAAEALHDPFLQTSGPAPSAPSQAGYGGVTQGSSFVQALQRFGVAGAFRQVALSLVAEELMGAGHGQLLAGATASDAPLDDFRAASGSNASFRVPMEDVMDKIAASNSFDLTPAELAQLTSHMDVTNDGHVDRHELISSLIDWEVVAQQAPQAWQDALGRVFARLDHNRDGCICMSDIKAHLSAHHVPASSAQQQARDMLRDVDLNSDGCIAWAEFYEALSPGGRIGMMPALHHFDGRQRTQ
eukprot:jgi/Tetstr1/465054/TSEL_009782.t1